jgi:hypothetical protein
VQEQYRRPPTRRLRIEPPDADVLAAYRSSQRALEVHRQAAGWFWHQEIFDFVAAHLHLIVQHSLRTYRQAYELKQAGLDWRRAVLSRCLTGPALLVARLRADPSFASEAARVRAFIAAGAGCRATYFHYAQKLRRWPMYPSWH